MSPTDDDPKTPLFNPGKAEWLQHQGKQALNEEQRALLLALAQLESEKGRPLTPEEQETIQALAAGMKGYDAQEIARAVQQMVETPTDPNRKTSWPELRRRK